MPPTSIISRSGMQRADGRAGQGDTTVVPSECRTATYERNGQRFYPPLKYLCVRDILAEHHKQFLPDTYVIKPADAIIVRDWFRKFTLDGQRDFFWGEMQKAWDFLTYSGKTLAQLPRDDPAGPRDAGVPGADALGSILNSAMTVGQFVTDPAKWLAMVATALGAFLVFRGMRGVFT